MTALCRTVCLLMLSVLLVPAAADAPRDDDGFVPMFNGKDLTGWVNVNCAPGTFSVKDGEIITTGRPTGFLRTAKQYENFIADFEWMHVNAKEVGNSGFFVWADPLPAIGSPYTRGIEVQVLVNLEKEGYYTSQGDLFSIWGATCKPDRPHPQGWSRCLPSEKRCKGGGEWNHYKVIANNGVIKLHVNGKEVSGLSECHPRKGYLALESEGAECHFRNLKIKELPTSDPKHEDVADLARGFKNLYTGLDLSGWKVEDAAKEHWQLRDWVLHYDGKAKAKDNALRTDKQLGDCELIADFRFPSDKAGKCEFGVREGDEGSIRLGISPNSRYSLRSTVDKEDAKGLDESGGTFRGLKPAGQWNRLHVILKGDMLTLRINGKNIAEQKLSVLPSQGAFALRPEGEMDLGNLFVLAGK